MSETQAKVRILKGKYDPFSCCEKLDKVVLDAKKFSEKGLKR
jgi:hypothetical protein